MSGLGLYFLSFSSVLTLPRPFEHRRMWHAMLGRPELAVRTHPLRCSFLDPLETGGYNFSRGSWCLCSLSWCLYNLSWGFGAVSTSMPTFARIPVSHPITLFFSESEYASIISRSHSRRHEPRDWPKALAALLRLFQVILTAAFHVPGAIVEV